MCSILDACGGADLGPANVLMTGNIAGDIKREKAREREKKRERERS